MCKIETLYTWQSEGHDIVIDEYKRSESQQLKRNPCLQIVYDVFDVKYGPVLWCTKEKDLFWAHQDDPRDLWEINVHPNLIVATIDKPVWHKVVKEKCLDKSEILGKIIVDEYKPGDELIIKYPAPKGSAKVIVRPKTVHHKRFSRLAQRKRGANLPSAFPEETV